MFIVAGIPFGLTVSAVTYESLEVFAPFPLVRTILHILCLMLVGTLLARELDHIADDVQHMLGHKVDT